MHGIDNPDFQDNRNYNYSQTINVERSEYSIITELVERNSSVIDLGCGNGLLMQKLIKERNAKCKGMEISESAVELCRRNGLDVSLGRIDAKLPFKNDTFDYSICNVTIQMVNYPEVLLKEMKRVSKHQIISFPNFAFYKNRLDLLFKGRMPRPMLFGYKWYNTGHLHQLSMKDFKNLVNDVGGLKILNTYYLRSGNPFFNLLMKLLPNLFQTIKIVVTCKD